MRTTPVVRARELRGRMSLPETLLWVRLRRSGVHFRRQHPVPPYTLDFFCRAARLAVEVDGQHHEATLVQDGVRDEALARQGILTRRIAAGAVLADPDGVAEAVLALARERIAGEG